MCISAIVAKYFLMGRVILILALLTLKKIALTQYYRKWQLEITKNGYFASYTVRGSFLEYHFETFFFILKETSDLHFGLNITF